MRNKFEALNSDRAKEVMADSHLKESKPTTTKEKTKKNQMVYGIPVDLAAAVDATGESLSSFAKRAMLRLAKEEDIF